HEKNVVVGDVQRQSDTQILVRGVDSSTSGTFRDIVTQQFTDWTMTPAAGEANGYLLTFKPSLLADLQRNTMDQSLETIKRRIDALGLTDPTVAVTGRGADGVLVELRGEGDAARAVAVIKAGGQVQYRFVMVEKAYPHAAAVLAAHG